jgi:hypothetical protein
VSGSPHPWPRIRSRHGRHSTGKSCLYVKRPADVDVDVLREMVRRSYAHTTSSA